MMPPSGAGIRGCRRLSGGASVEEIGSPSQRLTGNEDLGRTGSPAHGRPPGQPSRRPAEISKVEVRGQGASRGPAGPPHQSRSTLKETLSCLIPPTFW